MATPSETQDETLANKTLLEPPGPPPVTLQEPITITKKVSEVSYRAHLHSKTRFFKTVNKIKRMFHKRRKMPKKTGTVNEVTGNSLFNVSDRSSQHREAILHENFDQLSSFEFNRKKTDRITLYQELRLVERQDKEINAAWKGAHLILFFLTFVFGSFCTFCFHVLMYMFDEKCVLSPKMVALKREKRKNSDGIIIDYIAVKDYKSMPVEFVTTIWVDKNKCYLPTYVPLFSGICGLIWTTMFMMSSSGTHTLSGLQRPWRVVPAVFIFSTMMSILCIYTTVNTHNGLLDLCDRLAEVFGSDTCSYIINVATISYERRIRGVYQATRLTMAAAWLHTLCWVSAALLALARMLLIVDFCLVRVRADLIGNIELMLERHEKLIRTNEYWNEADTAVTKQKSPESIKVHFLNKGFGTENEAKSEEKGSKEDKPKIDSDKDIKQPRSWLKKLINSTISSPDINSNNQIQQHKVHSESEKTLTFRQGSDDTIKNTTKDIDAARNVTSSTEHSITSGVMDQWMPTLLMEKLSTLKSYIQSAGESLTGLEKSVLSAKEEQNETVNKAGKTFDFTSTPYDSSTPGPSKTRDNSTPLQPDVRSTPKPSPTRANTTPSQPYDPSTSGSSETTFVDLFHKDDTVTPSVGSSQKKEKKKEKQD